MNISQGATFTTKFNQLYYECELYLDNGEQQFPINPNAVVNLSIKDTLADWVVKGTLSFFYVPELGSSAYNSKTGNYSSATTNIRSVDGKFFNFLNDGNDYLRIRIKPISQGTGGVAEDFVINDETHWTKSYLFSVYNMEDIDLPPGTQNAASATLKCLKLYFWDHWYQKLTTNLMEYSTALSESGLADIEADKAAGIYSNYGMIPTGIALKEIIEKGLKDVSTAPNPIGSGSEDWEDGASRIFYTTPAQTTAEESLEYVYSQHLSSVGKDDIYDVSILIKEKGPGPTDLGYFTLRPLHYYFKKSTNGDAPGEFQIEHFFLQSYTNEFGAPYKTYRAPIGGNNSDTIDVKLSKYNIITNYRFVDIAAVLNETKLCSSPVYSFDFKNRTFKTEFQKNTVFQARSFIADQYIKNLYGGGGEDEFLPILNDNKINKNLTPEFSLYGDTNPDDDKLRQLPGIQKLLYLGVFQNACVNFRTLGLTHREPGRFIAIDKTEGVESGPFEDKFFGQWFIIDVKHVMESEMYYNDITAVKVNRFRSR